MANNENLNPFLNAQNQIKIACEKLGEEESVYEILKEPLKVIEVSIPVRMDDGSLKVFKGYRSQHNDAVGPFKGGIRFHPDVNADEVKALSIWMSFKCSITGIPYGGGKGGITVDPSKLSKGELERLSRGYIQAIHKMIGEKVDIPAPDVNTNGQIMSWMVDEYCKLNGQSSIGVITGKPLDFGGSKGRTEATGLGIFITAREIAKRHNLDFKNLKVAVQGFGNVGSYTAIFCQKGGAKVVSIAEYNGIIYNENGLDIPALLDYFKANRTFEGYPDGKLISAEEFWKLQVDIILPCAMENAITSEIANNINAKIIVEGANGPITADADEILAKRGVCVIPDILANSGGVTVSYFEWVQNLYGYYWSAEEVMQKQEIAMVDAFESVYSISKEFDVTMRTASYMHSIRKIANAMRLRGWI